MRYKLYVYYAHLQARNGEYLFLCHANHKQKTKPHSDPSAISFEAKRSITCDLSLSQANLLTLFQKATWHPF